MSDFSLAQQDVIIPPPKPPKFVPLHTTIKDAEDDLRRKQQRRKPKKKKKKAVSNNTDLDQLRDEKRIWKLHMSSQLMIPYTNTQGNLRDDYQIDPGLLFNMNYRLGNGSPYEEKSLWVGFRIAPFSGSGTYSNQNGKMSFLYWGPSFSISTINVPNKYQSDSKDSSKAKAKTRRKGQLSVQDFWRWSFGISALSRYSTISEDGTEGQGELASSALEFDLPGLWTEFKYGRIFARSISIDASLGTQTGESKVFAYAAVGMGLWY